MVSYCVIHFNEIQEKTKILNYLACNTTSQFFVTSDLKEYAAKHCNNTTDACNQLVSNTKKDSQVTRQNPVPFVTKTEKDETGKQEAVNKGTIDVVQNNTAIVAVKIEERQVVDKAALKAARETADLNHNDMEVAKNQVDDNVKDIATDTMKKEVKAEKDLSMSTDEESNKNVDVATSSAKKSRKSADYKENKADGSMVEIELVREAKTRYSLRNEEKLKRPLLYDDEFEQREEEMKRKRMNPVNKCQKCSSIVDTTEIQMKFHVIQHSGLRRFECSVDRCEERALNVTTMMNHNNEKHKDVPFVPGLVHWSDKEVKKFQELMKECFPQIKIEDPCGMCNQVILTDKACHATHHLPFMTYKCTECSFESSSSFVMSFHGKRIHDTVFDTKGMKIELTEEQEDGRVEIMMKCFPED